MNKNIILKWHGPISLSCFHGSKELEKFLNENTNNEKYVGVLYERGLYLMCSKLLINNDIDIYCLNYIGGAPNRILKTRIIEQHNNILNSFKKFNGSYTNYELENKLFPFDILYGAFDNKFIETKNISQINIDNTSVFFTNIKYNVDQVNEIIGEDLRENLELKILHDDENKRKNYIEQIEHALINSFRSKSLARIFNLNLELVSYNVPPFIIKNEIVNKNIHIIGLNEITTNDYDIVLKYLKRKIKIEE
jgi:hypothetical protein